MSAVYQFERGETIVLAIDCDTDPGAAVIDAARMRRSAGGAGRPLRETPIAASFDVTARAAAGDVKAGWDLTLPAASSALLACGHYWADAVISVNGQKMVATGVSVLIVEPATVLP